MVCKLIFCVILKDIHFDIKLLSALIVISFTGTSISSIYAEETFAQVNIVNPDPKFCNKTLDEWEALGANVIIGTDDDDEIRGTNDIDVILGMDGNDLILGKNGDDCLIGGNGDDFILGETINLSGPFL